MKRFHILAGKTHVDEVHVLAGTLGHEDHVFADGILGEEVLGLAVGW